MQRLNYQNDDTFMTHHHLQQPSGGNELNMQELLKQMLQEQRDLRQEMEHIKLKIGGQHQSNQSQSNKQHGKWIKIGNNNRESGQVLTQPSINHRNLGDSLSQHHVYQVDFHDQDCETINAISKLSNDKMFVDKYWTAIGDSENEKLEAREEVSLSKNKGKKKEIVEPDPQAYFLLFLFLKHYMV